MKRLATLARVLLFAVMLAVAVLSDSPVEAAVGTIETAVGTGDGGAATNVSLAYPQGIVVDAAGDLFIADANHCRVRRVTGAIITTAAGSGFCDYGGDGGPALEAGVSPGNVALAANGDLYISGGCRIRRVAAGVITTVAGDGMCAYFGDGGPATSARLRSPGGMAFDASGDLYIADSGNCRIRRVSGGNITTVAGNGLCGFGGDGGSATSAMIDQPQDVVIDDAGDLFIAEWGSCHVRRVSVGTITTVAGNGLCASGGDGGLATAAMIDRPSSVDVHGSTLYVNSNCSTRAVTAGIISTVVGNGTCEFSGDGGPPTMAGGYFSAIDVDDAGDLHVVSSCRVRRVRGGVINTVAGNGSCSFGGDGGAAVSADLWQPFGIAVKGAAYYVADTGNCRIRKVSAGTIVTVAGNETCGLSGDGGLATAASLDDPYGVAVDNVGDIYIADTGNCRIRKVSGGVITTVAGVGGPFGGCGFDGDGGSATAAVLNVPQGVAITATGDLLIADSANCRIRMVSGGVITTVAGTSPCGFSGDGGLATDARLGATYGVAAAPNGDYYIGDYSNCRVRRVSGGMIETVAGTGCGSIGFAAAVAVDGAGDLYVADRYNCRIQKVSGGVTTTVAGTAFVCGYSGDGGAPTSARLHRPAGIAADVNGDLYIADTENSRVRVICFTDNDVTGGSFGGTVPPAPNWILDGVGPEGATSDCDAFDRNDDNDLGCTDVEELGFNINLGGMRDPLNPWDFADVPTPALPGATSARNRAVSLVDVGATLAWVGRTPANGTDANGRNYTHDNNANGVVDGAEYDRTPNGAISGPPNDAISLQDVGVVLNQVGDSCVAAPN